ncbi:MAG: hypothetical protein WCA56_03135 [Xanthobacteraceae bacterium]
MKPIALAIGLFAVAILPGVGRAQAVDDPFSDYLQRSDTILLGAGNAKDTNEAIHTITPWPPYVGDTRIPLTGRQAVDSVQRMYHVPDPFQNTQAAGGVGTGSAGEAGSVSLGMSPPAPVQPVSGGY